MSFFQNFLADTGVGVFKNWIQEATTSAIKTGSRIDSLEKKTNNIKNQIINIQKEAVDLDGEIKSIKNNKKEWRLKLDAISTGLEALDAKQNADKMDEEFLVYGRDLTSYAYDLDTMQGVVSEILPNIDKNLDCLKDFPDEIETIEGHLKNIKAEIGDGKVMKDKPAQPIERQGMNIGGISNAENPASEPNGEQEGKGSKDLEEESSHKSHEERSPGEKSGTSSSVTTLEQQKQIELIDSNLKEIEKLKHQDLKKKYKENKSAVNIIKSELKAESNKLVKLNEKLQLARKSYRAFKIKSISKGQQAFLTTHLTLAGTILYATICMLGFFLRIHYFDYFKFNIVPFADLPYFLLSGITWGWKIIVPITLVAVVLFLLPIVFPNKFLDWEEYLKELKLKGGLLNNDLTEITNIALKNGVFFITNPLIILVLVIPLLSFFLIFEPSYATFRTMDFEPSYAISQARAAAESSKSTCVYIKDSKPISTFGVLDSSSDFIFFLKKDKSSVLQISKSNIILVKDTETKNGAISPCPPLVDDKQGNERTVAEFARKILKCEMDDLSLYQNEGSDKLTKPVSFYFPIGKYENMETSQNKLAINVREVLKNFPRNRPLKETDRVRVYILGFASGLGEEHINFDLSTHRAEAISKLINPRNGEFRMLPIGMGENLLTGNQPLDKYGDKSRRADVFACK